MRGRPDPKPAPRVKSKDAGTLKVAWEARCRICGETWPLTRHHLVSHSLGGDDLADNIVPLCGDGTRGCHGDVEGWRNQARERLRPLLTRREVEYVVQKCGQPWLDRCYPHRKHSKGSRRV